MLVTINDPKRQPKRTTILPTSEPVARLLAGDKRNC